MMGDRLAGPGDISWRLRAAFPAELSTDLDQAFAVLPPTDVLPSITEVGPITVDGERLRIPSRIHFPEPAARDLRRLSDRQRALVSCLYTRHHDGFVRERQVRALVSSTDSWVAPFVVALVGEYVVEIIEVIAQEATTPAKESYARFAAANPEFSALTQQRVISYWSCYYRPRFRRFRDYPGFQLLRDLGLWPEDAARFRRAAQQ